MIFEVRNCAPTLLGGEREEHWVWWLKKSDSVLCRAGVHFESEEDARADIAAFRKSMGVIRFAKVVTL